jgi:signal transduction histidine kinase
VSQTPTAGDARPMGASGWSLRRRLFLTFVVLGILVATGTALAGLSLGRVNSAQHRQVDRLDPASKVADDLFISLLNQETGLRGYALTRQAAYLQPFNQGRTQTDVDLRELHRLLSREPDVSAQLAKLEAAARTWQQSYTVSALATIRATPRGAIPRIAFGRGKQMFDTIRTDYNGLSSSIADARRHARDQLRTATQLLYGLVIGAAVLAVIISLVLFRSLRRWVTTPLSALRREVRTVAGGELEHAVVVNGPPDIVEVGQDAELMRQRLINEYFGAVEARRQAQAATEQVEIQAEELRRSNAELEQFAYIASHDLQEPLRKVASFCQMLGRRYSGQLDERGEQYIAFAVDGAKRMQSLINDLLAFSRVGRTTACFRPVDLNACVAAAESDLETLLAETEANIEVGDLPEVPGDGSLLRQLFLNLIGNAVKFRGSDAPRVRITAERDGDFWAITAADNGIGIDPRYAEKVFAIFTRLHPRDQYEGTGIGLALCRKIVEFHGGTIDVVLDPPPGASLGGATLRFTLPVTAGPTPAPPAARLPDTAADSPPATAGSPTLRTGES